MIDSPAVQIPRIRCAICNTMVEKIEWWDEHAQSARVIRVHCHGATDTMTITIVDFMRLGQRGMDEMVSAEGLAFSTQMLNQGVKPPQTAESLDFQGLFGSSGAERAQQLANVVIVF